MKTSSSKCGRGLTISVKRPRPDSTASGTSSRGRFRQQKWGPPHINARTSRHGTSRAPLPDVLVGAQSLIGRLLKAIAKYPNAALRLDAPLVELVVEEGVVVGAIVDHPGGRRAIRARKACFSRPAASRATMSSD